MEQLYLAIKAEIKNYTKLKEVCGETDPYTIRLCSQISGMMNAFEIAFGISYVDYVLTIQN